jgi:hypothetical protein
MAYEISPDPATVAVYPTHTLVVSPAVAYWPSLMGIPQESRVSPAPVFWPWLMGAKLPTSLVVMIHGIPGTTTIDDEFPEDLKPQFRVTTLSPTAPEYLLMYHGIPGVKTGDDNWDVQSGISDIEGLTEASESLLCENGDVISFGEIAAGGVYRPQLRLNTLPHTADPVPVEGTWRVNEVFLPQ